MSSDRKHILLWHQGAIGDLILSIPSLCAIRKKAGNSSLHLIARTDMAEIMLAGKLVDEFSAHEKSTYAELFADGRNISGRLSGFLEEFDEAYIFMKNMVPSFFEKVCSHIPECFFIETFPQDGRRQHIAAFQVEQVTGTSALVSELQIPEFRVDRRRDAHVANRIVLHPGSGGRKKCWPLEKYLELARLLGERNGGHIQMVFGPSERGEMPGRASDFILRNRMDVELIVNRPLSFIASLLQGSTLSVGNDSGISHLSALLGVPTIALFGPTDPEMWKPLGGAVRILRSGYSCSPCSGEDYRRCFGVMCMETLDTDSVLRAAEYVLLGTF